MAAPSQTADALRGRLVAATATPMNAERAVDPHVLRNYLHAVVAGGADGLAVGVHTGRGPHLDVRVRAELVRAAREQTDLVITAASSDSREPLEWARLAAQAGAVALLVLPTPNQPVDVTLTRYDALWHTSGLPLIVFDLYTAPYQLDELCRLLDHPGVAAFKPARLYDAVACQDGIAAAVARGRCVLTGEDRLLGPSLTWGADGALIGLAAAAVSVSAAVVRAHRSGDAFEFLRASRVADELAAAIFRPPWDGYIQRLLWATADEGLIPREYAVDPWRPAQLSDAERPVVVAAARKARRTLTAEHAGSRD